MTPLTLVHTALFCRGFSFTCRRLATVFASGLVLLTLPPAQSVSAADKKPGDKKIAFRLEETTISELQRAIQSKRVTSVEIVKLYLARIKAYNGPGVSEPGGILGPITPLAHAKGVNALSTLNLRPATRKAWGFDDRKARSMTDATDSDPAMPDALEVAAELDRRFAATGKLVGPLHGVVIAIKDQYDTFDLRTTSGADAFYANDRPPHDSTFVKRLRDAGAIILAKANMGEYASGYRSSFGGTTVNAYDTERVPGGSSGGSAVAVAANLVTCAIAEETGPSVRAPAQYANTVGLAPTQELVSRKGMINIGLNTRVGPITRTVEDTARILDVIAGYDPKDEMTAFALGRMPAQPYESFTHEKSLKGLRIGVVREYMDKSVYTKAEYENIDLVDRAIEDLRKLGATIIDPGASGLFTDFIRRYNAELHNVSFTKQYPDLFPVDAQGKPTSDHVATLVELAVDPSRVPGKMTLRDFGPAQALGEGKYGYDLYLTERGDTAIKTLDDLITKANFWNDPQIPNRKGTLQTTNKAMALDTTVRLQRRFAVQQIVLQCFAEMNLDAVVYPTGLNPPRKIAAPNEPTANGIGNYGMFTFLGAQGFPAITVPAGFTAHVYDRERDPSAPKPSVRNSSGGDGEPAEAFKLVGPVAAQLPVGVDFLGRPFSEPILLRIAATYTEATSHRRQPADFGPLQGKSSE